ncbi:WD repeat-containing protein 46-like isoform X2 [Lingula anatina]|uniref:WD repeat-containing protein 46 n=1 Tax=Lingula anatina TaxID=7574 RepID=A0A1S3IAL5_LINAN|nr:WD repeat-containing protein 46-like isoform X2 [Lingula anatina]|eukprot:XP_013394449.1 WD repeat-containing protein 46-like isoform X2 [Lingula anatina]
MEGEKQGSPRELTNFTAKKKMKSKRYFDEAGHEGKVEEYTVDVDTFLKEQRKERKKKIKELKTARQEETKSRKNRHILKKKNKQETDVRKKVDPYPGDAPISKKKLQKYGRGEKLDTRGMKTKYHQDTFSRKEQRVKEAVRQAARSEFLLSEEQGYLEADEGEETSQITQHDMSSAVDITSAQKYFELELNQFGPYRMNYTRNGRFLLIAGRKGHVAAMDWQTKKLMCEMNVMETAQDVKWLHIETMFAVAQKQWTYIYDNQGIELHCLKALDCVLRMEFLPYHFLLASANAKGYLSYLDVSIGQKVAGFQTHLGRLDVMCQNPHNAIIHLGHAGGTVSLWSPNVKEPLVKMLCHGGGVRSVAVNNKGMYMATSGVDRYLKIWDMRMFKPLQNYRISAGAGHLAFSQKDVLAAGIGNVVEVYQDCCRHTMTKPYLSHRLRSPVANLQFCPYEDVLGVGHGNGFSSLLVPGAGEANYDALETNPYQTKQQRRQAEVKMLLEKIQPDMISLDTGALGKIDTKTLQEKIEERNKLLFLKPQKIDFEPKYKMKGKSKGKKHIQRKKGVMEQEKKETIRKIVQLRQEDKREKLKNDKRYFGPKSVLDRFKKKSEAT